jgi:hypothetical protein
LSWQDSKWAVKQTAGSAGAKAVLLVLAEACRDGACFLAHETIAEAAEMDRRSVVRHMQTLDDSGLIRRERRFDGFGHRTSDRIKLVRDDASQGDNLTPGLSDNLSPGEGEPKCQIAHPKVTKTASLSDSLSQEPSSNLGLNRESAAKPARRQPETPIPESFPDLEAIAEEADRFLESGYNIDAAHEAEKFRANAETNDRRLRNWRAGFRTWCLKARDFAPATSRIPKPASQAGPRLIDWPARIAGYQHTGYWEASEWGPKPGKAGCEAPSLVLIAHGYSPDGGNVVIPMKGNAA